jgi:hypothetical protein
VELATNLGIAAAHELLGNEAGSHPVKEHHA